MEKKIFVILQDSAMPGTIDVVKIKEFLFEKGIPRKCMSLEVMPEGLEGKLVSIRAMSSFKEAYETDSSTLLVMLSSSRIYGKETSDGLDVNSFAFSLKRAFPKLKYAVSSTVPGKEWKPIDYWFDKTNFENRSRELAENIFQIYTESK